MGVLSNKKNVSITSRISSQQSIKSAWRTAIVLTTLLVLFVPLIALTVGVPLLLLVPLAGLTYFVYIVWTDQIAVGFGSAFFILLTFNANVPILSAQEFEYLNIYLFDLVLIPVALLGIYWYRNSSEKVPILGIISTIALALFALWSILSGIIGNGPSQLAALIFGLEQMKLSLVLLTAILYVLQTDPRFAVFPLLIAVIGHACFAFAQAVNGTIFGLSYLGEASSEEIAQTTIGPLVYQAGQHTGGFVGTSRVLSGILLLCIPIFAVQLLGSRREAVLGLFGASVGGVLILMSSTDAGWVAFVGVMLLVGCFFGILYGWRANALFSRASLVTILAGGIIALLHKWNVVTSSVGKGVAMLISTFPFTRPSSSSNGPEGASSSGESSSGSSSGSPQSDGSTVESGGSSEPLSQGSVVDMSTLDIRLRQYDAALDVAREYPLFGIGGSNFEIISTTYGIPRGMSIHNIFLAHLAATGFPGLLLFLISLGAVFLHGILQVLRTSSERQLLIISILAGFLGYLAFAFWTTLYNSTPAMATFWGVCGIVVGMNVPAEES